MGVCTYRENSNTVTVNGNFAFGFSGATFSPSDFLCIVFSFSKSHVQKYVQKTNCKSQYSDLDILIFIFITWSVDF